MPLLPSYLVLVICLACASGHPDSYLPGGWPTEGRIITLEDREPHTGRTTVVVTIRERPGHKTDGELQIQHWHRRDHKTDPLPGQPRPDSVEQIERRALEVSYGCGEWQPMIEYHGDWGWVCLAPFARGQPNWAALAQRIDDFRARRPVTRATDVPIAPPDTLLNLLWHITVWTPMRSYPQFASPMRFKGGTIDAAAVEYNAEGAALIDSIKMLARR